MKKSCLILLVLALGVLPALAFAASHDTQLDVQSEKKLVSDLDLVKADAANKGLVAPAKRGKAAGTPGHGIKPSFNSNRCRGNGCAVRQIFDHPIVSKDGKELPASARTGDEGRSHDIQPASGYEQPEGRNDGCKGPTCGITAKKNSERLSNGRVERHDKVDGAQGAANFGPAKSEGKSKGCRGASCLSEEAKRANAFTNPAGTPDKIDGSGRKGAGSGAGFSKGPGMSERKNPAEAVKNAAQHEKLFNMRPNIRPERLNDNPRY